MPRVSVAAAIAEVAGRDPVMAALVERVGPVRLTATRRSEDGYFAELAESIAYQQLAGKAAAAIWARFRALVEGDLTPEAVLALPEPAMRSAGLSGAKAASIRDLAAKVADGTVPLGDIHRLSDDDIVDRLVAVRGIGRWTAEMFLIFTLRRLDVWPVDDYGVRKGWTVAYGLAALPTPKELMAFGERFRPYRTIAALYCWRAVDTALPGT
ncbi:MAG TPA: DNA-3-methyladenine glycosylase 2 family protein [Actinomycetota bacterium]|nr:DNA-3-methyladenine glycosylase 2 family protein [Actinomycetota bacterium]